MDQAGCGALIITTRYNGPGHHLFEQLDGAPRILLTRRGFRAPTFPGCWACPAGLMEAGESPQHTVQRECEEEVGVTFVPESEPFYEGTWENRTLRYFVGSWSFQFQEGVRLVDGEAIGFDWCTFEDTLELDLAFRYREALLLLRKKKLL